jgi:choline-sulfatase
VGYLLPHWPFICPEKYLQMYDPSSIDMPLDFNLFNENLHPALSHFQHSGEDNYSGIRDEAHLRRIMAVYYGMITCMDDLIGEILDELENQDIADNTYVIYVSDHGEGAGEHGLFNKMTPYEASVAVPLVISGPGIPRGKRISDLVSLVDLYPTILDIFDLEPTDEEDVEFPGKSWLPLLRGERQKRLDYIFSEYHGIYFRHNWYMLLRGNLKYIWYAKERPSLFDLKNDPQEMNDLALEPGYASTLKEFEHLLREIVDPEATSDRAKKGFGLITEVGKDLTQIDDFSEWKCDRDAG